MARGKSGSRRKSTRRPAKTTGSGLWPWVAALVVVGGGLALYENSAAAKRFVSSHLTSSTPTAVASKPIPVPAKPVPPAPLSASVWRDKAPKPAAAPEVRRNAALIPPAPIGKPGMDETSKPQMAKADPKIAGAYQGKFFLCGTAKQDDCVVSADRFVIHGQKIRLVGIEVPDIKKPRCETERIKASDAELRVRAFLDSGPFELVTWAGNDAEVDGHQLREIKRNGMALSDILVREGLAKRPGTGNGWC